VPRGSDLGCQRVAVARRTVAGPATATLILGAMVPAAADVEMGAGQRFRCVFEKKPDRAKHVLVRCCVAAQGHLLERVSHVLSPSTPGETDVTVILLTRLSGPPASASSSRRAALANIITSSAGSVNPVRSLMESPMLMIRPRPLDRKVGQRRARPR